VEDDFDVWLFKAAKCDDGRIFLRRREREIKKVRSHAGALLVRTKDINLGECVVCDKVTGEVRIW